MFFLMTFTLSHLSEVFHTKCLFSCIAFTEMNKWVNLNKTKNVALCSRTTHPHRASYGAPASRLCGRTSCCRFHRSTASRRASSCAWKGCCWWRRSASRYRTGTSCHLEREEERMNVQQDIYDLSGMWPETSFKKKNFVIFVAEFIIMYLFIILNNNYDYYFL